ncbi:MAG: rRNA maturation RNase YbeY [Candidatus Levybacteria bacterium]|nr:rRNA maturation RNase YbeY [Candidatus Levybacteria bacterium]
MSNVNVQIFVESRYKVNRRKIKTRVEEVIKSRGITSPVEVSVAIVGDRKMTSLNKKYRNLDKTTNVLSFSQSEGERMAHNSDTMVLGDVVISYPVMITEASAENMLVDDKICFWVQHGLQHLLGEHHE